MATTQIIVMLVVLAVVMVALSIGMIWILRRLVTNFLERNHRR